MSEWSVEVEGLARRYGRRWALVDVSFRAARGSVTMIVGPNGAGKSTLLRLLATAIRPHAGSGRIAGFDLVTEREDVRRRTAILAHHDYLYESLTARENLQVVADHIRVARSAAEPLLERVGLVTRGDDVVSTFSAGMRKRLSLARVLLQEPEVLLLDEPYGSLDPAGLQLVDDVLGDLKRRGAAVLISTHAWERSARAADRALVLNGGRVASDGPAAELLSSTRAGGGSPRLGATHPVPAGTASC